MAHAAGIRPVKVRAFSSGTPEEWVPWKKYFRGLCLLYGWDDERSRRELLLAMDGEAARRTSDIEFQAAGQTLDDLLASLEGRFITASGTKLAEQEFRKARQGPDKSVLQFHGRMRELFTRAYPAEPTEGNGLARYLRDNFIWGLHTRKVSVYVQDQQPDTYAQCLEHAQAKLSTNLMEAASRGRDTGGLHALQNQQGTGNQGGDASDPRTCHGCGKPGHFIRQCPAVKKAQEMGILAAVKNRNTKTRQAQGQRGGKSKTPAKKRGMNQISKTNEEGSETDESGNEGRADL